MIHRSDTASSRPAPSAASAAPAALMPPRGSALSRKREQEALDGDAAQGVTDSPPGGQDSGADGAAEAGATPEAFTAAPAAADEDAAAPQATTTETEDNDRGLGVPLFGLFSGAGVAGIAMLAGGGSSSDASSAGQSPTGGDVAITPPPTSPQTPATPTTPTPPPAAPPSDAAEPAQPAHPDPDSGQAALPPPPRAGQLVIQLPNDTGASALDRITADPTVNLRVDGAEPDASVRIERSPDGGNTWEVVTDPTAPWPEGQYLVQAVVSNAGGASTTPAVSLTIDSQAPAVAELVVLGAPTRGEVQLAMNGVEAGAAVAYQVSVDQGQTWHRTLDALPSLMDGQYQFRGVVTDAAGNQSFTAPQTVTVDTEPPAPVTLQLRKVGAQGWEAMSALSSTGDVNLKLPLAAGVTARYEQSSDGGATWTAVTSAVRGLPEGHYSFRAFLQDAAGNETALAPVTLTVDRTPPPAPQIFTTMEAIEGDPANGYLTTDGSYQFILSHLDPGARTFYFMREAGTTEWKPASGSGTDMLDGRYECRAGFQDAAGNFSYSNILALVVDTRQPGAGTITLSGYTDRGWYAFDHHSSDNEFTLVHIPDGPVTDIQWQLSTDDGGHWVATTEQQTPLDYPYLYRAIVTDDQGQTYTTRTIRVNVSSQPPAGGTLVLQDLDDTGSNNKDVITQDGAFTLAIQNEPEGTFTVYEISDIRTGGWSPTGPAQDLPSGTYFFRAISYEPSGVGGSSNMIRVVVDRDAPAAGPILLSDFDDTGAFGDSITSDTSFTLALPTLETGATVRYARSSDGGETWADTAAVQQDLADGVYQFRAEVTDLAGNSSVGRPITVTIDTTAPDAGSLSLNAGPGGSLGLQWTGPETPDTLDYQVSLDQGQTWLPVAAHAEAVPAGSYLFRAVLTDAAGNGATTEAVAWEVPTTQATAPATEPTDARRPSDPSDAHAYSSTEALWVSALGNGAALSASASLPVPLAPVI
ncbi:Ig-like domain-containing protein [Roseateles terrae]|uniref:Bacterial Ig-like domain-containing protein n=1 Tax=Roseateles terrae TaxID=431060 RepID=A0ABR6GLR2_9BURK|nr:Ig-like domain-containing protein [Roseateles terrae]MBB3193055.1 hypothetical protein [Roseateles terrae]OWQ89705.1 hypothetical protein CDN98_04095 [Roseateles terrae]